MVRLNLNNDWSGIVNNVLDRAGGLFDELESIESTVEFIGDNPDWKTLGQYDSWRPAILLSENHFGNKYHTVLHELGHHLHYLSIYEHPQDVADSRDEWSAWFYDVGIHQTNLDGVGDAEFVADTFAAYHQGELDEVPDKYYYLDGPELGEPIATDL